MNGSISWDEYFMCIAEISALRSKDPCTKVGCCIVNDQRKIIGIGYNGMPIGIPDDSPEISWERPDKYKFVVHAEVNAVLNTTSNESLRNSTLYCTLFPCNECTKVIIQAGIKKIYYEDEPRELTPAVEASKKMLDLVGIPYLRCIRQKNSLPP